jgi:hypothetical protein
MNKQTTMSINQFMELERGNITLKEIKTINNTKFIYVEISVLISTLFLIYIIGLISVIPMNSEAQVVTAFEEILNIINF